MLERGLIDLRARASACGLDAAFEEAKLRKAAGDRVGGYAGSMSRVQHAEGSRSQEPHAQN